MNNLSRNLMMILSIFVGIKETISDKHWLSNEHYFKGALPLIQNDKSSLRLAIPHKYDRGYAIYSNNENRSEKLKVACPAPEDDELIAIEKEFKSNGKFSEDGKLFVMRDYSKRTGSECSTDVIPSIKKVKKKDDKGDSGVQYCGHFEAELYDVGYPILKENKTSVRFASMYQLCYSKMENKGTQYTIHRIQSPISLLRELWKCYEVDPTKLFKSSLDKTDRIEDKLRLLYGVQEHNYYPYQLVGFQDMPINPWEITTLFHFNFVPITKNVDVLLGMMAADNYIRLYSKKKNERLTLYSGAYEVFEGNEQMKAITSFWRIIMDNSSNAIIIVTQRRYDYFICNENLLIVKEYTNGCTYKCSVDENIIKRLGLPQLEIKGMLDLTLAKEVPANATQSSPEEQQSSPWTSSQVMNISDFLGEGRFMEALKYVDAELAKNIKEKSLPEQPWIYREVTESKKGNTEEDEDEENNTEEDEDEENNTEEDEDEENNTEEDEDEENNTEEDEDEENNTEGEHEENNTEEDEDEENNTEGKHEESKDLIHRRRTS